MNRYTKSVVALLLLTGLGLSQPPAKVKSEDPPVVNPILVDVPDVEVVQAGGQVNWQELTGKAGFPVTVRNKSGKPVYWLLIDDKNATITPSDPDKEGRSATAVFGSPFAARYRILAVGLAGSPARIAVTLEQGPVPPVPVPPGPGPDPIPVPPVPQPVGKVAKFVVVESTLKAGAWRGDLLGSPAFASFLTKDGIKYRIIDVNGPEGADPEAADFIAKSVGKELPWLWTFDAAKTQIESVKCPTVVADFMVKITGEAPHKRAMGNRPPPAKKYAWKQFGAEPNVPLIPRAEWKSVDLNSFLPVVHDQDGKGQCNASATATVVESARTMAGLPYVYLSAGDLYSQINDGRDQGSTLEDGLFAAMTNGIGTTATVPYVWDGRNHSNDAKVKAERQLYRVLEAYECKNFDGMASALQQGFFIVEGLMWYDNFTPDRDGWLPTKGIGKSGGHALAGFGLVQRGGVWGIRTRNSWSASWGKGGNCIIPEPLFGQQIGGFWAVRAVVQTGADFPVVPKLGKVQRTDPYKDVFTANLPTLKP